MTKTPSLTVGLPLMPASFRLTPDDNRRLDGEREVALVPILVNDALGLAQDGGVRRPVGQRVEPVPEQEVADERRGQELAARSEVELIDARPRRDAFERLAAGERLHVRDRRQLLDERADRSGLALVARARERLPVDGEELAEARSRGDAQRDGR